jgi:hypothetical protein
MEFLPYLIVLIIGGVIFYFIESQVPMSEPFKLGVRLLAVVIVLVILYRLLTRAFPHFAL